MFKFFVLLASLLVASGFKMGSMGPQRSFGRLQLDMKKKSVKDLSDAELKGKRVFVRCDLNVPMDKQCHTSVCVLPTAEMYRSR